MASDRSHSLGKQGSRNRSEDMESSGGSDSRVTPAADTRHLPTLDASELLRQLRDSTQEMALVDEVARIVTSSLDIDEVFEQFGGELKKLVDFERIVIHAIDEHAGTSTVRYRTGTGPPGTEVGSIRRLEGLRSRALIPDGKTVVVDDISLGPEFPLDQHYLEAGLRSVIIVALVSNDRIIGSLTLRSQYTNAYGEREQMILERLAKQIAGAVENSQLYAERLQAEEAMRASDEKYRTLVNESPDFIFVSRIDDFRFTEVNDRACGHYGYTREQFLEMTIFDIEVEPRLREEVRRLYDQTPVGRVVEVYGTNKRKDGTTFPVHVRFTKLNDEFTMANIGDITQQKKAEELQKQWAEQNSVIADIGRVIGSSLDIDNVYDRFCEEVQKVLPFDRIIVAVIDEEGVNISPTWISGTDVPERRRGTKVPLAGTFAEAAVKGRSPTMLEADSETDLRERFPGVVPDFRSGMRSFLAVPLIGRNVVFGVLQIRSKQQGIYTRYHLDLAERIGNQMAGAIANAQLHVKTRLAEDRERQRSEELGALLKVAGILSDSGRFEFKVGRVLEELTRIAETEAATFRVAETDGLRLVGSAGSFSPSIDLLPYEGNIPGLMLEQRRPLVIADYPNHPLASPHYLDRGVKSTFCAPVISQGIVLGELSVASLESSHFTPERVNLLMAIINGLGTLLERARLEEERQQTEERMHETARLASIGELAAGVAHEINNPLTSVVGYSEMVLRHQVSDPVSGYIQTIYDEAQRAAKIVQNLLFFTRGGNTEKQYLDLGAVLNRSLEMKSYDFKANNIELVCPQSTEIPKTMVDEHQLIQVFLNVLTNAEQAIHQVSPTGCIWVDIKNAGDQISVMVKDDGPGIPSEHMSRIFEPFYTTKEIGQGTGLGLSICYGIIKRHGGSIWAESIEGNGTTFHITLPVVGPEGIDVPESPASATPRDTKKRLLVVDDEPHIRDLLKRYFELERYAVGLAQDGQEALEMISQTNYDGVLLDISMPAMNGLGLYRCIEKIDESLARKVVFITGDTVSSDTREFLRDVGKPVVTKPFRLEELLRKVQGIWDHQPAMPA